MNKYFLIWKCIDMDNHIQSKYTNKAVKLFTCEFERELKILLENAYPLAEICARRVAKDKNNITIGTGVLHEVVMHGIHIYTGDRYRRKQYQQNDTLPKRRILKYNEPPTREEIYLNNHAIFPSLCKYLLQNMLYTNEKTKIIQPVYLSNDGVKTLEQWSRAMLESILQKLIDIVRVDRKNYIYIIIYGSEDITDTEIPLTCKQYGSKPLNRVTRAFNQWREDWLRIE